MVTGNCQFLFFKQTLTLLHMDTFVAPMLMPFLPAFS